MHPAEQNNTVIASRLRKRYSLYIQQSQHFRNRFADGKNKTFFRENVTSVAYNEVSRIMAKKQTSTNESVAPVVPSRAAKPNAPRTRTAKHSKAITVEPVSFSDEPVEAIADAPIVEEAVVVTRTGSVSASGRQEAIARLAYGYWAARGFQSGNPLEDWVRAENEYDLA